MTEKNSIKVLINIIYKVPVNDLWNYNSFRIKAFLLKKNLELFRTKKKKNKEKNPPPHPLHLEKKLRQQYYSPWE